MKEWGFWEWAAYGALLVAALVVAADTGFKTAPEVMERLPEFFRSSVWGFAPVVLVLASTTILILREFVFPTKSGAPVEFLTTTAFPSSVIPTKEVGFHGRIPSRMFVGDNITPEYLMNFQRDDLLIQANKRMEPYIGKWIEIGGILGNIAPTSDTKESPLMMTFERTGPIVSSSHYGNLTEKFGAESQSTVPPCRFD